jgi:asparagine synthase (glutamine-hydrolysing)
MCGIAGIYNLPELHDQLQAMVDSIAHRGPDAAGRFVRNEPYPVALGHRRLSIIDLSPTANQPLVKDGLVLAFNGEIYNYRALQRELSSHGTRFSTNSDTEVLLEAWRTWGPAALNRLRGMFAFALFDERTGRLVLARDPFGIKPLFWAERDGGVMFASELKAMARALPARLEVDHGAIVASLLYYWVPETHCVYRGVSKLPPGYWLEATPNGRCRMQAFYDPAEQLVASDHPGGHGAPPKDAVGVHELRTILEDSVAAHLTADVPVGTFLSGGLDSSLLTVLAARQNTDVDSYTIAFREEDQRFEAMPDDLLYARRIARAHGIRLHEIEIAPNVAELLPRIVEILDEPIGDAAAINTFLICTAARDAGLKVLLSGMGADELFAGYRKHYAGLLAARYRRLPGFVRNGVVTPVVRRLPVSGRRRGYRWVRWAKRFVAFANLPEEAAFRRSYTHYDPVELRQLVSPDAASVVDDIVAEHAAAYWDGPAGDQVNRMCYTDLRLFLPGLNLAYTDRVSMAASVEVRVPYVDKEVVAAAFRIPGHHKIQGKEGKAILKQAAEAWLPKDIVYRPKALFSAPLRAWMRRDLKEMVDDCVAGGWLVGSGLLNGSIVRRMIDEDRRGLADRSKELWQLLTLECWYQQRASRMGSGR